MSESDLPIVELRYDEQEGEDSPRTRDLLKGRAFVPGQFQLPLRSRCQLVVSHPRRETTLSFAAEVVWLSESAPAGVGVQLLEPPATIQAQVSGYLSAESEPGKPTSLHERVRTLGSAQREALARQGSLTERVALERCFGGAVWEALLRHPQLTTPEVTRIAKNGALPRPLVNVIVSNGAWLATGEVQRALLSNPRVSGQDLDRVLRALPRQDLELAARQTAYRPQVRTQAARLIKK